MTFIHSPHGITVDWEKFANLPKPSSIENIVFETIVASFPADKGQLIYFDSLQYLGWLNGLPTVSEIKA